MIKHIVTFKLNGSDEERRALATRFAEALNALPASIPQLKSMEAAVNINQAESWDIVLTATADTMADVATYSAHPAHVAAVAIIAPYKAERACVDYEI
ncbi:MAG: Dabb family protein [Odoribacter sp.]|nr:Dabb family protein [Odoribacter sp.]